MQACTCTHMNSPLRWEGTTRIAPNQEEEVAAAAEVGAAMTTMEMTRKTKE